MWNGGVPYALTFADDGLGQTAWDVTNGMSPLMPHNYTVDDVEWGEMG